MALDPAQLTDIELHRTYLMRYALAQARDATIAEEAVQETLLAALESIAAFRGRSTLRTWLTSILRFKLADQRRLAAREPVCVAIDEPDANDDAALAELFDQHVHWRVAPQAWANPAAALEQRRFWEVFERCLAALPAMRGRVFFKREVLGEEIREICRSEGITPSNCWVILHRARLALRARLESQWFVDARGRGRSS